MVGGVCLSSHVHMQTHVCTYTHTGLPVLKMAAGTTWSAVFVSDQDAFVYGHLDYGYDQVCCSVLQCVAACCSVLRRVAVCCSVLQRVAVWCNGLGIDSSLTADHEV